MSALIRYGKNSMVNLHQVVRVVAYPRRRFAGSRHLCRCCQSGIGSLQDCPRSGSQLQRERGNLHKVFLVKGIRGRQN